MLAPIAWLYARNQRKRIAIGELRDTGRMWLRIAEVIGATFTLLLTLAATAALGFAVVMMARGG